MISRGSVTYDPVAEEDVAVPQYSDARTSHAGVPAAREKRGGRLEDTRRRLKNLRQYGHERGSSGSLSSSPSSDPKPKQEGLTADMTAGSATHDQVIYDSAQYWPSSLRERGEDAAFPLQRLVYRTWWWWELSALLLSVICVCLVVAVLIILDKKPLASWQRSVAISPNAAISVLTTVGKTAMMLPVAACISQLKWPHFQQPQRLSDLQSFDDASRGPWGSLRFLLSTRGPTRAALGAVITVIALGYEPSAQQILSYPSRNTTAANETAFIMRADQWMSKSWNWYDDGWNDPDTSPDTFASEVAIMNGIIGQLSGESFACSKSACNFEDFTSLGLCSECQDISNAVDQRCDTQSAQSSVQAEPATITTYSCNYTPHNESFASINVTLAQSAKSPSNPVPRMVGHLPPFAAQPKPQPARSVLDTPYNLTAVQIKSPTTMSGNGSAFTAGEVQIYTCTLAFCAQNYSDITVQNGRLSYSTSSSLLNQSALYDFHRGTEDMSDVPGFFVDMYTNQNFWRFFTTMLDGAAVNTLNDSTPNILERSIPSYLAAVDLPGAVANVSRALTNLIMSTDNLNATRLGGSAVVTETYVHVRWPWIIPPLCLTLATMVLLALSIMPDPHSEMLLKSSVLAPMFHGLDGWQPHELHLPAGGDARSLEDVAKGMRVVFTAPDTGVKRFVKVE